MNVRLPFPIRFRSRSQRVSTRRRRYEEEEERHDAPQPTWDDKSAADAAAVERIASARSADEIHHYLVESASTGDRCRLRRRVAEHARHWDTALLTFAVAGNTHAYAVARNPYLGASEVEDLASRYATGVFATTGFTTGMVNRLRRDVLRALIATHGLSVTSHAGVALYEQARALDPTCEAMVPAPRVAYEMFREFPDVPEEWRVELDRLFRRWAATCARRETARGAGVQIRDAHPPAAWLRFSGVITIALIAISVDFGTRAATVLGLLLLAVAVPQMSTRRSERRASRRLMEEQVRRYANTMLDLGDESRVQVDLRWPLLAEDRAALRGIGLPATFAVITADNPFGQRAPDAHNDVAEESLGTRIQRLGVRYTRAVGCSPDRSHCEDGFAVELPRDAARELAREFRQDALFWFDGSDFWLDGAMLPMVPVRLPLV